eukprot:6978827-Prorocentrum_lima.AAC.1
MCPDCDRWFGRLSKAASKMPTTQSFPKGDVGDVQCPGRVLFPCPDQRVDRNQVIDGGGHSS